MTPEFKKNLMKFVQERTEEYNGVFIRDFTSSFKNGLALCALVHSLDTSVFVWDDLDTTDARENINLAIDSARKLGIETILEAGDILDYDTPDETLITMFISDIYKKFGTKNSVHRSRASSGRIFDDQIKSSRRPKVTVNPPKSKEDIAIENRLSALRESAKKERDREILEAEEEMKRRTIRLENERRPLLSSNNYTNPTGKSDGRRKDRSKNSSIDHKPVGHPDGYSTNNTDKYQGKRYQVREENEDDDEIDFLPEERRIPIYCIFCCFPCWLLCRNIVWRK